MKQADLAVTNRILRRETHSARTAAAAAVAVLGILFFSYVLLESVLQVLGQEAWLIDPPTFGNWLAGLPADSDPLILGLSGALIFFAGLLFFLQAVLPGRRARYSLPNPRAAVVVDGEVLAASLARCARMRAGVTPQQVLVTVGRTVVEVQIRPTSGTPVDAEAVRTAVEDELLLTKLDPQPAVRVRVAETGVIGQ
ncbi:MULTISPECIES: DUF6286 domain-containing protein [unclassified Arthrobacter]|uniref:DUF6286 domain-containing protein n=1 Tax=unclassified Arthrobacter TaxID=235627 RepID=UPI0024DF463F|nr:MULTISPECIES: DUF6286 domain-containing protein [unclassified Arthrobacter]MCC9144112.1 DUF6286 domain-containing protein [Arthrobacter sp. zg-Y919]MDK1275337.1 DUF6286 domain-containing protein [Arthrobacter sp. zg.Y919]MDM7990971.1 DUF6286 domain-containing protein [Arthrobacter sp. zg-Y877]WIB03273.1 DUF6286 domain-containing protein [Arthrobacter sp. zg-Y919]